MVWLEIVLNKQKKQKLISNKILAKSQWISAQTLKATIQIETDPFNSKIKDGEIGVKNLGNPI